MRLVLVILLVALSGCTNLEVADCRNADWYDLGFRDAIYGLQPQDGVYADQCGRHNLKVDVARYGQGWREGKWEHDDRLGHSID